jgi:membrane protein implicated in regulation of membrane protease activity
MALSLLASRTLTIVAAAFLGFDGATLLGLGIWAGRTSLVVVGLVLFLSSGLVLLYWRRYRRQVEDIAADQRALRQEVKELRNLLHP